MSSCAAVCEVVKTWNEIPGIVVPSAGYLVKRAGLGWPGAPTSQSRLAAIIRSSALIIRSYAYYSQLSSACHSARRRVAAAALIHGVISVSLGDTTPKYNLVSFQNHAPESTTS